MKKSIFIIIGLILFTLTPVLAQRGNGNIVKVEKQAPPFTEIRATGMDHIILINSGNPYTVITETDENLQDKINVKVKGSTLHFSYSGIKPKKLKFYVNVPQLERIDVTGAADVQSTDTIKVHRLNIDGGGAADLRLDLKGESITIHAGGAADIRLAGKAEKLNINSEGAAEIKAGKLLVDSVFVHAGGASNVIVHPIHYIHKKASGAAEIKIIPTTKGVVSIDHSDKTKKIIIMGNDNENNDNIIILDNDKQTIGWKYSDTSSDTTNVKIGNIDFQVIEGDTTKVKLGRHELIVDEDGDVAVNRCTEPDFNGHWGGVELGINGYVTPEFNTLFGKQYDFLSLRYEKSLAVNVNLYEQNFGLNRAKTIGIVTGIGITFNNYRFSQPVYLSPDSMNLSGFYIRNVSVRKSKLTAAYVTVPILFEVQSKNEKRSKRFHAALGGIFGARIASHTKIYFNEANKQYNLEDPATNTLLPDYYTTPNRKERNIIKSFNSFSLQPFRVDATARIGYGPINLFATYALTPMFQKNRGPELNHWTVGITLVGW